ncbi:MAG TPA: protein kinase [Pyrinomonadaceae bacterium]|nr:protein kinase [Pyrinomonadaceae bacterium]
MSIDECLKCLIQALSRNEPEEVIKRLAVGCDAYRFYLIFGGNFLWRMLNGIPASHLQIDHEVLEEGVARAVLRAPDTGKWSTVWLKQTDEVWQVTAAYPVRPEEMDENGELPEDLHDLLCGRISVPIDCQDAGLTRFLNDVHREWKRINGSTQALDSKKISIFAITDHLWTRRTLWNDLRQMGYDTVPFCTTMNNDVYVCSDGPGSPRVAVKMLHNTSSGMKEKFLNEIEIQESLRHHPGVPRILFSATAEGYPYFGCEWATGKVLAKEILKSPAWSLHERVRVMMNLARLICDFRSCNVIHRDLATDHIFVRKNFELSVIDFGMSSFLHQLSPEKYQAAHSNELRNFGLIMCYILIEDPKQLFGQPELCLNDWDEAMARLRVLTVPLELIRIIERTVAIDPACSLITRTDKPPYSTVEEILAALEQVSSVLEVESSDAVV